MAHQDEKPAKPYFYRLLEAYAQTGFTPDTPLESIKMALLLKKATALQHPYHETPPATRDRIVAELTNLLLIQRHLIAVQRANDFLRREIPTFHPISYQRVKSAHASLRRCLGNNSVYVRNLGQVGFHLEIRKEYYKSPVGAAIRGAFATAKTAFANRQQYYAKLSEAVRGAFSRAKAAISNGQGHLDPVLCAASSVVIAGGFFLAASLVRPDNPAPRISGTTVAHKTVTATANAVRTAPPIEATHAAGWRADVVSLRSKEPPRAAPEMYASTDLARYVPRNLGIYFKSPGRFTAPVVASAANDGPQAMSTHDQAQDGNVRVTFTLHL